MNVWTAVSRHSNLDGQINLRDAIRGNMTFKDPKTGKTYALKDKVSLNICGRSLPAIMHKCMQELADSPQGAFKRRHPQRDKSAADL